MAAMRVLFVMSRRATFLLEVLKCDVLSRMLNTRVLADGCKQRAKYSRAFVFLTIVNCEAALESGRKTNNLRMAPYGTGIFTATDNQALGHFLQQPLSFPI